MHKTKQEERYYERSTLISACIGFIIGIVFYNGVCNKPDNINPRTLNGIDTIYTADSLYKIHFTIDTSIELPANDYQSDDTRY